MTPSAARTAPGATGTARSRRHAAPLPSGRRAAAGLTKAEVKQIQRARMLAAMADAVAEVGYPAVVVTDVIARAGVSRATFYEQFADKQDCFLSAFDFAVAELFGELFGNVSAGTRPGAFADLLARYLDALIADVALASVFLIDVYAAGPEAFRRRAASQQWFVEVIAELYGVRSAKDRFACEMLVAAVGSMVTTRLADRDLDGLRALHGPIVRLAEQLLG